MTFNTGNLVVLTGEIAIILEIISIKELIIYWNNQTMRIPTEWIMPLTEDTILKGAKLDV
jgi:hypothetical protein